MGRLLRLRALLLVSTLMANPPPDLPGPGRRNRGRSAPCPQCGRPCRSEGDGWYYCSKCNISFEA